MRATIHHDSSRSTGKLFENTSTTAWLPNMNVYDSVSVIWNPFETDINNPSCAHIMGIKMSVDSFTRKTVEGSGRFSRPAVAGLRWAFRLKSLIFVSSYFILLDMRTIRKSTNGKRRQVNNKVLDLHHHCTARWVPEGAASNCESTAKLSVRAAKVGGSAPIT